MADTVVRGGTLVAERLTQSRYCDRRRPDRGHRARTAGGQRKRSTRAACTCCPASIDVHLHFNEPGRTEWEGAATGSRALAAGGGTLFFDMPLNSTPCTVNAREFDRKRAALEAARSPISALWGGLVPGNVSEMAELADAAWSDSRRFCAIRGLPEFPRADDLTLFEGLREAARLDLPVAVHAESQEMTQALAQHARSRARRAFATFCIAPGGGRARSDPARHAARGRGGREAAYRPYQLRPRRRRWLRKRGRAASMSPSRRARTTCSSRKKTWSGWARSRNARRRCGYAVEQERSVDGTADGARSISWHRTIRLRRRK